MILCLHKQIERFTVQVSTLWQCFRFCIYASDLVIFCFFPWGFRQFIPFFFLVLSDLDVFVLCWKKRQLNLDLLQNCWDIVCAWNLFTHREHFILFMDFRNHYTLQVLQVTVASKWSTVCVYRIQHGEKSLQNLRWLT